MTYQIVHADDSLIVLEKSAGLLAVPGRGAENQENLAGQTQRLFPNALIVHRLDRDTSGLMVMARGFEAQRNLSRQFEDRNVEKRYMAVVYGSPDRGRGWIDLPMRKDFDRPPRQCVDFAQGRPAITEWRVVERKVDRARLELAPLTGRSHQLRLHLEQIGHPILGDKLYAHEAALATSDRLLLHATRLSLVHPASGQVIAFASACPF
ncbi:MAG TPA: RluA family pseudouridine synthase [Pirellulales bacterium]|jgi:tRNA pseudouridine32 synthase/23S rRNA pseudouridine746 synthase|nr:RluA family pseudouridine synthase [Pirellulales bacterium]